MEDGLHSTLEGDNKALSKEGSFLAIFRRGIPAGIILGDNSAGHCFVL